MGSWGPSRRSVHPSLLSFVTPLGGSQGRRLPELALSLHAPCTHLDGCVGSMVPSRGPCRKALKVQTLRLKGRCPLEAEITSWRKISFYTSCVECAHILGQGEGSAFLPEGRVGSVLVVWCVDPSRLPVRSGKEAAGRGGRKEVFPGCWPPRMTDRVRCSLGLESSHLNSPNLGFGRFGANTRLSH